MKKIIQYILQFILITSLCNCNSRNANHTGDKIAIQAEIDEILKIQEDAYNENNEEGRRKLAATCDDSLIFIGGDDGGLSTSANFYVHDLADGYSKRPGNRYYRIYDNTVIVTSVQQTFKVFNKDTIFFNARSTKVFVKEAKTWKMAYVTYAPLPVLYNKVQNIDLKVLESYAGLYKEGPSQVDTISVINGRIFITVTGSEKSELFPINDSTFFGDGYFGKTVFARNSNGVVTHSYFEFTDGQRLVFPKIK